MDEFVFEVGRVSRYWDSAKRLGDELLLVWGLGGGAGAAVVGGHEGGTKVV